MAAPTAVLEAAISQLASNEEPSNLHKFVPAKRFAGAKAGYFFSSGPQGVGYYRDTKQATADVPDVEAPQPRRRLPTAEELLEAAEQQAAEQVQLLDSKSLKRLILQLERKVCCWVMLPDGALLHATTDKRQPGCAAQARRPARKVYGQRGRPLCSAGCIQNPVWYVRCVVLRA